MTKPEAFGFALFALLTMLAWSHVAMRFRN